MDYRDLEGEEFGKDYPSKFRTKNRVNKSSPYDKSSNKSKRRRINLNPQQLTVLEKQFQSDNYPQKNIRERLAAELDLSVLKVTKWFDNRRSKKRKTETDSNSRQYYTFSIQQPPQTSYRPTNNDENSHDDSTEEYSSPETVIPGTPEPNLMFTQSSPTIDSNRYSSPTYRRNDVFSTQEVQRISNFDQFVLHTKQQSLDSKSLPHFSVAQRVNDSLPSIAETLSSLFS